MARQFVALLFHFAELRLDSGQPRGLSLSLLEPALQAGDTLRQLVPLMLAYRQLFGHPLVFSLNFRQALLEIQLVGSAGRTGLGVEQFLFSRKFFFAGPKLAGDVPPLAGDLAFPLGQRLPLLIEVDLDLVQLRHIAGELLGLVLVSPLHFLQSHPLLGQLLFLPVQMRWRSPGWSPSSPAPLPAVELFLLSLEIALAGVEFPRRSSNCASRLCSSSSRC
jgi:hypothetical protein